MQSKNFLVVVAVIWWSMLGSSMANAQAKPQETKRLAPPVEWHWTRLSLEANFPNPYGKVVIVVRQSKENFAPKITDIEVSFNGHKLNFQKSLLKGLVMADDPEIGYHTKNGKISSIFVVFQYGYPIREKSGCETSNCDAYPVAEFVIDKDYRVTRNNYVLPVD